MAQPQSSPSAATSTTVSSNSRTAVSKTPALESPQIPATFVNWEGEKPLHIYMIDYCRKRGFWESVKALSNETKIPTTEPAPIDAPQGFLFEWWVVYWEISQARREQVARRPLGTDAANAYLHAQRKKAELQQQQQHHEAQMRVNAQQQATSLWSPQAPPGEYGRPLLPVTRPGYPTAAQIHGIPSNPSIPGQYPPRMNGIGPGGATPQIPHQARPYGQPGQLNPALGLAAPQNPGPPQPSQMAQMNIANAHKFAQNGLSMHAQTPSQQPQQPGAQPHPTPNYQQSTVNRGMYSGPSPHISHANPSPPQNNSTPNHPQQPVQQNSHPYHGMNVNANPASQQTNLIRQTSQPSQQQQQSYAQAREPTPRPSSQQISTNQQVPAPHPHSASSTPAPNQQNIANAQGQSSPNRDTIAPRPRSQPQPQNAQQGGYPVFGQYGSGPGGVFTQPSQPGIGQGTMSTLGLAVKKEQGEGGPEIDAQGHSGPQKVAAPTRPLGRTGSGPAPFVTPAVGPNAPSGPHQPQPQLPGGSLPPGHAQVGMKRPGSPQYGPDRNQDASTPDQNKRPRRGSISSDRVSNPTNNPSNNPGQPPSNPPTPGYPSYATGPYGAQNRTPIAYTQPRPGPPMQQMNATQRISSAPAPGVGANQSFARLAPPLQNQAPNPQNPPQPQQGPPPPQPSQQQQQPTQKQSPASAILGSDPNRHGSVSTLNTDAQAQVATLNRPAIGKPRISGLGSVAGVGVGRGSFVPSSPSMAPTVAGPKGMMPPPQIPGTTAAAPPGAPKEKGKEKEESMSSSLSEAQNDINTAITQSPMIKNIEGSQKPPTPAPLSTFSHPSISPVASASNPPTPAVSASKSSGSAPTPVAEQLPYSNPIAQPSGPAPLAFADELYFPDYSEYGGMTGAVISGDLGFDDFLTDLNTGNGVDMDDVGVIS